MRTKSVSRDIKQLDTMVCANRFAWIALILLILCLVFNVSARAATLTVTNVLDDGSSGSLRERLAAAALTHQPQSAALANLQRHVIDGMDRPRRRATQRLPQ